MSEAKTAAREILQIIPLVMRTIGSEMRQSGHMPAQAHFGLLFALTEGPHNLSELAEKHNVSLPTMSNSVTSLVDHGYVERIRSPQDRRKVIIELTGSGRDLLKTMQDLAVAKITEKLDSSSPHEIAKVIEGLSVLRSAFSR